MLELNDSDLLRRYAEGHSEEAFAALVARHINKVYSAALRHTRNPSQAEEVTQAVFVILAKKARSLAKGVVVSGWLYQTARLASITFLKSEIRRARREQEAHMQNFLDETANDETWMQIAPLLDAAMAGLSESDRHAVVLRYFDGKSMREVGAALGASEDAAKKRLGRALEKLQRFFAKRGVSSTTAIIAGAISSNSVQAVPPTLANAVTTVALAKGAATSTSTLTLVKGVLKVMAWTKMKTAIVAGIGILLAVGTTTVIVTNSYHHLRTTAEKQSFKAESTRLINQAKMATLYCMLFAGDHRNQLPASFAQLNAWSQQTKLSDADWEFVASGEKNSFNNPARTIYFLEKEPRQGPDGKFVRVYATVDGRVFLLTSPGEDFTAAENQRGFLIPRTTN